MNIAIPHSIPIIFPFPGIIIFVKMANSLAVAGIFMIGGFISHFIAFVSPFWLVAQKRANSQFEKIGLWEACLKNYVDPEDYVSKLYNGCWWIFWPEFREIRYWLNPGWFITLQVLAAINFVIIFVALLYASGLLCHCCDRENPKNTKIGLGTTFTSFMLSGIVSILFGLGSIDRTWMPKTDYNVLDWGYWLYVLGGFFTFISWVALMCRWVNVRDDLDFDEKEDKSRDSY